MISSLSLGELFSKTKFILGRVNVLNSLLFWPLLITVYALGDKCSGGGDSKFGCSDEAGIVGEIVEMEIVAAFWVINYLLRIPALIGFALDVWTIKYLLNIFSFNKSD